MPRKAARNDGKTRSLPNVAAAWDWACQCFGITEKDYQQKLRRLRQHANPELPGEHYPMTVCRTTFSRARRGGRQGEAITDLCREALYDRIIRNSDRPSFAFTASMAHDLTTLMLRLYEKLLPRLKSRPGNQMQAMRILVENVFAPAVFAVTVRDWQRGLGTEFQGENCWYLSKREDGRIMKPVAVILDRWLRVAGFRTAYGISKEMGGSGLREAVEGWLRGEEVPTLASLHELVDRFADRVAWLDDAAAWQSRFLFASAAQRCFNRMDEYFAQKWPNASTQLAQLLRDIADEGICCNDDGGVLSRPEHFFAVRLVQLRLKRERKWRGLTKSWLPKRNHSIAVPEMSDAELEKWRQEFHARINLANHFRHYIESLAVTSPKLPSHEHIFELGAQELNLLLAGKGASGQKARQP